MKKICVSSLLLLWVLVSAATFAQASGKIVFTKSEYTRKGFEQAVIRGSSKLGWWDLFRRDVCIINPDGTGFKQLTDDGVSYRAEWSLDGQKIAFLSSPAPTVNLYVMNADGSDKQKMISNQRDIHDFDWSPDGTAILAYVKTRDRREPDETWLVTISDGGSIKRMGSSKWARGWNHWAAQGATVLNPNRRLIDALPEGVAWPEWSPNNKYLAFIHEGILGIADLAIVGMPEDWRTSKLEPPCNRMGDWTLDSSKILFFAAGNVGSINFDGTGVANS